MSYFVVSDIGCRGVVIYIFLFISLRFYLVLYVAYFCVVRQGTILFGLFDGV